MKQHITIKQWDELTHDQKDKLDDYGCKNDWRMTVGQMIWFLGEDWWRSEFTWDFGCVDCEYQDNNKELCDTLWEAVKEKL